MRAKIPQRIPPISPQTGWGAPMMARIAQPISEDPKVQSMTGRRCFLSPTWWSVSWPFLARTSTTANGTRQMQSAAIMPDQIETTHWSLISEARISRRDKTRGGCAISVADRATRPTAVEDLSAVVVVVAAVTDVPLPAAPIPENRRRHQIGLAPCPGRGRQARELIARRGRLCDRSSE
ncbi:hypothetical protein D9M72_433070 [compost metagenome]